MAARKIDASELIGLEEYKKRHHEIRREIIGIRDLRRVEVGPWVSFTFENRRTVLYQIQEMIRVEHLTDPAKVQEEIDAYEDLLPQPGELSATMFIEISDAESRERALSSLGGIEKTISFWNAGKAAPARDKRPIDPQFERPERASAVFYLGFALGTALASGAKLEIAHPRYGHAAVLSPETLAALALDLREI